MSIKNPCVNEDSTDDNFKSQEKEKEYQYRIMVEYQKLKSNPISLKKVVMERLENYDVKDFAAIFKLLYEFYTYGIRPEFVSLLNNWSLIIGRDVELTLYDRAEYIVDMEEKGRQQPT